MQGCNHQFSESSRACVFCGAQRSYWGIGDDEIGSVAIKTEISESPFTPEWPPAPAGFCFHKHSRIALGEGRHWHRFYYKRDDPATPHIPPAIQEGPPTLCAHLMEQLGYGRAIDYWCSDLPALAQRAGYDGIGLWLYSDRKSPMEYTLKPKIHWQRCIFIATMIAASMLVVLCRLWTSLPGTSLWH